MMDIENPAEAGFFVFVYGVFTPCRDFRLAAA